MHASLCLQASLKDYDGALEDAQKVGKTADQLLAGRRQGCTLR